MCIYVLNKKIQEKIEKSKLNVITFDWKLAAFGIKPGQAIT